MSCPNCDGQGKILVNPVNSKPVLVECAECAGKVCHEPNMKRHGRWNEMSCSCGWINNILYKDGDGSRATAAFDAHVREALMKDGKTSKIPDVKLTGYAQKIADAYAAQCDFHIAKNQSYGDSVFKPNEFGQSPETLIKARIADKIARLKTLTADGKTEAVGESIDDTITDLIGYLVCWKIVRKEAGK